jgi:hypothetical protein
MSSNINTHNPSFVFLILNPPPQNGLSVSDANDKTFLHNYETVAKATKKL